MKIKGENMVEYNILEEGTTLKTVESDLEKAVKDANKTLTKAKQPRLPEPVSTLYSIRCELSSEAPADVSVAVEAMLRSQISFADALQEAPGLFKGRPYLTREFRIGQTYELTSEQVAALRPARSPTATSDYRKKSSLDSYIPKL